MRNVVTIRSLLFTLVLLAFSHTAFGQIGISVSFGPPALPVYEQPICPGEGYIWTPGFWDYADDDYYWVPGTWVEAPQVGYLWTPGYWGENEGAFIFHEGYWGEHVGFYGGIDYGYGYGGRGYEGGRWDNGRFFYNTSVNRVNETIIRNTYNTTVINNNNTRVSYNGGNGGVAARPTAQEATFSREQHVGRVAAQNEHIQQARSNPQLRASNNQGKPPIAATAKPADFKSGVVPARQAGGVYKAPPANAARGGNETRTGNAARTNETRPADRPATATRTDRPPASSEARPSSNNHARDLQSHTSAPPNTGNAAADKRYQQQQSQLTNKQNQEHQRVQQQQERDHQQADRKNYNDAQKRQMEQRHAQQTQQVEQKHATQQQQMQQRQQPRPSASRPPENRPPAEKPH
jgi:hypothetical protein